MELEDQFGVKIPDEDAQKLTTVGQAVDYVVSHRNGERIGGGAKLGRLIDALPPSAARRSSPTLVGARS